MTIPELAILKVAWSIFRLLRVDVLQDLVKNVTCDDGRRKGRVWGTVEHLVNSKRLFLFSPHKGFFRTREVCGQLHPMSECRTVSLSMV